MKKIIVLLALVLALASCDNATKDPAESSAGAIIKTKADLTKSVKNLIKEYSDFARDIGEKTSSRAATKDEVATQLKDMFDEIYKPFEDEDMGMSILKLILWGEGADTAVHLEKTVDLADIKPSVGMDAYIDLINHVNEKMIVSEESSGSIPKYPEEGSNYTNEKMRGNNPNYTLETFFGDNYLAAKDFLDIAEDHASIPKLYAFGKLDIDPQNDSKYASGAAKLDVEVAVNNINALIPKAFTAYSNHIDRIYIPTSVNLPITAIKRNINLDVNAAVSKANYEKWVEVFKTLPGWDYDPEWNFQYPDFVPPICPCPEPSDKWNEEEYNEWAEKYESVYCEWQNECYWAEDEYRRERWQAQNRYTEEWNAKWDEYRTEHLNELRNHLASASYPGTFSGKIGEGVSITVAGRTNAPGGIITLSLDASYTSPGKAIAFVFFQEWFGMFNDYASILRGLKSDYDIIPTVTVTDYSGKQTLKLEIDDIISVIDDVVNNFGEIIQ